MKLKFNVTLINKAAKTGLILLEISDIRISNGFMLYTSPFSYTFTRHQFIIGYSIQIEAVE